MELRIGLDGTKRTPDGRYILTGYIEQKDKKGVVVKRVPLWRAAHRSEAPREKEPHEGRQNAAEEKRRRRRVRNLAHG